MTYRNANQTVRAWTYWVHRAAVANRPCRLQSFVYNGTAMARYPRKLAEASASVFVAYIHP